MSVYELSAREIYDAYGNTATPEEILDQGRTAIANRLMREEGLTDEEALYAADQMLELAQEVLDEQERE